MAASIACASLIVTQLTPPSCSSASLTDVSATWTAPSVEAIESILSSRASWTDGGWDEYDERSEARNDAAPSVSQATTCTAGAHRCQLRRSLAQSLRARHTVGSDGLQACKDARDEASSTDRAHDSHWFSRFELRHLLYRLVHHARVAFKNERMVKRVDVDAERGYVSS